MAVVRNDQFEAFLERLPPRTAFFLLHGNDGEVASERARRLVAKLVDDPADPFLVVRLGADALAKDPGKLADEANAIPMFGGRRAIWIEAGGRDISALLAPFVEAPPQETSFVVEADNARKGSTMRSLFETRGNAAAIECYAGAPANLAALVETAAREAGVNVSRETRDELVAILGAEPATARGEIAKAMLYALSAGELTSADLVELAAGGTVADIDALVDRALGGDLAGFEAAALASLGDGPQAALAAGRLATRVALLIEMRQGGAVPERLNRLPFPVRRAIEAQAQSFAPDALARRLPALLRLLVSTRRSPALARSATFRALLAFASAAQRARR